MVSRSGPRQAWAASDRSARDACSSPRRTPCRLRPPLPRPVDRTHLGLDVLRGEIQPLFELRICRQVFSLDVELLDAMVQRVRDVDIVIGVESYSGRPVSLSFGAAKFSEAV